MLDSPLMMQQWVEEADRNDPLIPFKRPVKAFSYYHLNDGRVVGLWKHALTSISKDQGKTWEYTPLRAPGFVNSNAKIWGQKTADGRFATVYNPSEFRWPLAVSTSNDGLLYDDLLLINGEISTMRYGGNYKSYGPQYVRGIQEKNGNPDDRNMWLTYSMNKEDIWIAKVPVPISSQVQDNIEDDFATDGIASFNQWNTFSPLWASVKVENGALILKDKDPYDYAKAERVIPLSQKAKILFTVLPKQTDHGTLQIELTDNKGIAATRIIFDADAEIKNKAGYRNSTLQKYEQGKVYQFELVFDVTSRSYSLSVNGEQKGTKLFFQPVQHISKIVFRTGDARRFPHADTSTDQNFDVKNPGVAVNEASYGVTKLQVQKIN